MALARPGEREWDYLLALLDVPRFESDRIELAEALVGYADAAGAERAHRAIGEMRNGRASRDLHWEAKGWAEQVPKGLVQILGSPSAVPLGLYTLSQEVAWQELLPKVLARSPHRVGPLAQELAQRLLVHEEHGHRAAQVALAVQAALDTGLPVSVQYLEYVQEQHHSFHEHLVEVHAVTVREALDEQEEEIYYRLLHDGTPPEEAAATARMV